MNRRDYLKNTTAVLGFAVSSASMSALFIACTKEAKLDWKPVFLKPNHAEIVAEITETILPKTKTPASSLVTLINLSMNCGTPKSFAPGVLVFGKMVSVISATISA